MKLVYERVLLHVRTLRCARLTGMPASGQLTAEFREQPCGRPVVLARRRRWALEGSGFAVTKRMSSDRVVRRLGGNEG